jgi:hypothetical protein
MADLVACKYGAGGSIQKLAIAQHFFDNKYGDIY